MIAYSTIPGCVSWRNLRKGSVFISRLVTIFKSYAATEDVQTMLTRVNNDVTAYITVDPEGDESMQGPIFANGFRKLLYF